MQEPTITSNQHYLKGDPVPLNYTEKDYEEFNKPEETNFFITGQQ